MYVALRDVLAVMYFSLSTC